MTHAHITTWVIALILFFVGISMQKGGKTKPLKMVHMTLRLFYLFILGTGFILLLGLDALPGLYILKIIAGVWVIGLMEMILVFGGKGKSTNIFWIQLIIAFILALYLGLKLPLGFAIF